MDVKWRKGAWRAFFFQVFPTKKFPRETIVSPNLRIHELMTMKMKKAD